MEMTIEIPSDIEGQLAAEAEKNGVDPVGFVQDLLSSRLKPMKAAPTVTDREAQLLREVDIGFSKEQMEGYVALIEKRRDGSLSDEELDELLRTTEELERLNVQRMIALSELAELRGVSLVTAMAQLGIEPPDVL